MIRYIKYLIFFLTNGVLLLGQPTGTIFDMLGNQNNNEGEVSIIQDQKVDYLVLEYMQELKNRKTIPGYRVNIFRDTGSDAREKALNCRAKFIAQFDDYSTYVTYESPFHKVYVGDFRTKSEAQKALERIKRTFPNAFYIPYQINLPDIE